MFKFDYQLECLQDYLDFILDFLNGILVLNIFYVIIGKFLGKKMLFGVYIFKGCYVWVVYMKELVD